MSSNKDIEKLFKDIEKRLERNAQNGMVEVIQEIAKESNKICPKRTGALRKSMKAKFANRTVARGKKSGRAKLSKPHLYNKNKEEYEGSIVYSKEYAKYVHEMDDETTNWTTPGTHSHYLENPAYECDTKATFLRGFLKDE